MYPDEEKINEELHAKNLKINTQEAAIKYIIAKLPGHVYWKNKDGKYMGCNLLQAHNLGFKQIEDLIGKTDFDLSPPDTAEALREIDIKVMAEGHEIEVEEEIIKDGKNVIVLSKKIPLHNAKNEIIGILGISFDITDGKKMERDILQAKEAAEIANQAKSEFIANISYDIRNPLTGIIGMAQILEQQLKDPQQKLYALWLKESSDILLGLINNILDFVSDNAAKENVWQPKNFNNKNKIGKNLIN